MKIAEAWAVVICKAQKHRLAGRHVVAQANCLTFLIDERCIDIDLRAQVLLDIKIGQLFRNFVCQTLALFERLPGFAIDGRHQRHRTGHQPNKRTHARTDTRAVFISASVDVRLVVCPSALRRLCRHLYRLVISDQELSL